MEMIEERVLHQLKILSDLLWERPMRENDNFLKINCSRYDIEREVKEADEIIPKVRSYIVESKDEIETVIPR